MIDALEIWKEVNKLTTNYIRKSMDRKNYYLIDYNNKQYLAVDAFWGEAFYVPQLQNSVWKIDATIICLIKIKQK